jgi:hypothetical protein
VTAGALRQRCHYASWSSVSTRATSRVSVAVADASSFASPCMSACSARLTVPRSDLLAPEAEPGVLIPKRPFSLVTGITGALRWRTDRLSGGVDCGSDIPSLGVLLLGPTHVLLLRAAHSEVKFLVPEGSGEPLLARVAESELFFPALKLY